MMTNLYFTLILLFVGMAIAWRCLLHCRRKTLEATVYTASDEGMFISDENGVFLSVNRAFETLTGYRANEVVNQPSSALSHEILSREFYSHLQEAVRLQQGWEGEISDCHKDGSLFFKLLSLKMVTMPNEKKRYIGSFLSMTQIEEANQKLWYQANFDALTALPNRHMFFEHLQQQIERAERYVQQLGMIYLDLNNFDKVNYTIGHEGGNMLIKMVVERLETELRSKDLLYRIGGIEFVILLPNIDGNMLKTAEAILTELNVPFKVHNTTISISTNLGLVLYPEDGRTPDELLINADYALLASKREGNNRYARFDQSMAVLKGI